jgi:hypothetical protein
MVEAIVDALRETGMVYLGALKAFLPRVLATVSIVVVGWLIAMILQLVTRHVLGWVRFNALAQRTGAADVLKKVDLPLANVLTAKVVFWIVFVGFVLSGLDTLGFPGVDSLMTEFVRFVPRFLVALVILMAGLLAANFAWRATLLAAVNARLPSARLVSGGVRFLIVVMAVAMALEQLAVARAVVLTAFAIAFGALMLSVAIALGVGGAPIARRLLERNFPEPEGRDTDAASHL